MHSVPCVSVIEKYTTDGGKDRVRKMRKGEIMTKKLAWRLSIAAVVVGFALSSTGCYTMLMKKATDNAIILGIDHSAPDGIADGAYVCTTSRALKVLELINFGGEYYTWNGWEWIITGTKPVPVAIRVSDGKIKETLAVFQREGDELSSEVNLGTGKRERKIVEKTTYQTIKPVLIPELKALVKVSDFETAKSRI